MRSIEFPLKLLLLILTPLLSSCHPVSCPASAPTVRLVYEFRAPSWLENLAVRSNGSILATDLSEPNLYQVDPFKPATQEPWLIHTFPGYLGLLGIVETSPDMFAVVSGNFSLSLPKTFPGTYAVWRVDLRHSQPQISKITDIPQASFLNGIAYLPPPYHSLLLADSTLGVVFRLNLTTLQTEVAIDSPLMKKCYPTALEGINGMKVLGSTLYFTNAYCGSFAKLPIYPNGTASGPGEIIATTSSKNYIFDDFAMAKSGNAFLATGTENVITEVAANGMASIIAGNLNSTEITEPTALAFGRTKLDKDTLYVTTGGGLGGPVDGTIVVGGQIVAIDLNGNAYNE